MGEFNQFDYINEYNKKHYDRITVLVPAGKKEIIKAAADKQQKSLSEFISGLIDKELGKQ